LPRSLFAAAPPTKESRCLSRYPSPSTASRSAATSTRGRCSVDYLRNDLGLTGTHVGCDTGQCGACTVHLDGNAIKACTILAAQANGGNVVTIEGLAAADGTMHPMQAAFKECHGLQCGFCTPGMVMSAIDLVNRHPKASEQTIRDELEATCAAAPVTTTSSRRAAGRRGDGQVGRRGDAHAVLTNTIRRGALVRTSVIGASVRRKEDYRFLTGSGQYTTTSIREPHARVLPALAARAREDPQHRHVEGEGHARRGRDLHGRRSRRRQRLPCGWLITGTDGKPMNEPPHPGARAGQGALRRRPGALVIAETPNRRRTPPRRSIVDYDVLPASSTASSAEAGRAADSRRRPATSATRGRWATRRRSMRRSRRRRTCRSSTSSTTAHPNAIEPRAAVASYSRADDSYTLYVANQNPHVERLLMTAFVLGLPEHKVRVIAPDVGGGFGSKIYLYAEETAMVWASKRVNRPIKWAAERSEASSPTRTAATT
jgi:aerobic-type carbon monoxide dehydrogenase small subunit (CoxS/CutS family)